MTSAATTDAAASLKRNGKTFWLASRFLPKDVAADATVLYAFCRRMDDIADQQGGDGATDRLERVRHDLHQRRSNEPDVSAFLQLAERRRIDLHAAECLLDVLSQDAAGSVRIHTEAELLRYCYGAAGTVGLMMSAILQAIGAAAQMQAIDLGIAMQLTNIARDVQEDARMGRRYLPSDWVGCLEPDAIGAALPGSESVPQVKRAVERTLALADLFYASGARGFPAIPASARTGIRIAAAVYRRIGIDLRRRDCDFTAGRVIVSLPVKLRIAAGVYAGHSDLEKLACSEDARDLHAALAGLPGFAA